MKAMLLAAGEGRRLRPLTAHCPKPLLEVAGKPLIVYHLEALRLAGVREVVINVAYLGQQIIAALGDGQRWGLQIAYSREDRPLETAGGIAQAATLLGSDAFLVISADVWSDFAYEGLVHRGLLPKELARLVLVDNPPHHPEGDFSLGSEGLLQSRAHPSFTYSGIGVLRTEAVLNCSTRRERFPLVEVFRELMSAQQISAQYHRGAWTDVGTVERLQQLEQYLASDT